MKKEFVRNPYNYDSDALSNETGLECKDESLTEQEHAEEADINYIADRFMRTGEMKQVLDLPTPGDFEGIFDFQSAMNTIAAAKQEFMALPAKVRSRFNNDPAELLDFVHNPENRAESIKLGFLTETSTMHTPPTTEDRYGPENQGTTPKAPQATAGPARAAPDAAPAPRAEKP